MTAAKSEQFDMGTVIYGINSNLQKACFLISK